MNNNSIIVHPINSIYDEQSKILILGSFPSVKSREINFFYGHPQNRFWKVLSRLLGVEEPKDIASKKSMLLNHHIALWDVIHSCTILGSSDSSIQNVIPNDLTNILNEANIKKIYTNGKTAYNLYIKYIYPKTKIEAYLLPSTSPANASFSLDKLLEKWQIILENLKD